MINLLRQDTHRGEELPMSSVQQTVYALGSPQVTRVTLYQNSTSLLLSLIITIANTFFSVLLKYVENHHQWHHLLRNTFTPRTALT